MLTYNVNRLRALPILLGCAATFIIILSTTHQTARLLPQSFRSYSSTTRPASGSSPRRYTHVALASTFGWWHHDVLIPVGHSIEQALASYENVRLYVERPYKLGEFGFDEVVNRTGIYHGKQFEYTNLLDDMQATDLFPSEPGAMIDLIVLGTSEYDMEYWSAPLLKLWDERPDDKKFMVVSIIHDVEDERTFRDAEAWSIRGALRYMTLADHVTSAARRHLQSIQNDRDPQKYSSLLEYTPIDLHVPIIPLPDAPKPPRGNRRLTNAAVQGLIDPLRRDYEGILDDLVQSLKEDPHIWGYLPPKPGSKAFVPNPSPDAEPFQLHFVGAQSEMRDYPEELRHVVKLHMELRYMEYYELMQSMDVILPAFSGRHYYDTKASSTVVMAIQCNVPLLVTRQFHTSYLYAADDRVTITRPLALREVHALQVLRSTTLPNSLRHYSQKMSGRSRLDFKSDLNNLIQRGWERSKEQFNDFKRDVWRRNVALLEDIMRGI